MNIPRDGPSAEGMHEICLLVLPCAADLDLAISLELFRIANSLSNNTKFRINIATINGCEASLTNGRTISPTIDISDSSKFDLGLVLAHIRPAAELLPVTHKILRRFARVSNLLAGADYGPMLMASAGLLDGCRAVCHTDLIEAAQETYHFVNFIDELFVKDGERLTCAGGLSIADMLLSYVSGAFGSEFGEAVANEMMAAGPRPPHTSQRRRSDMSSRIEDERILAAITIMRENLETPVSISEVAARIGLSKRFLQKLWKNKLGSCPYRYYARERINRACSLLVFSDMSIEEIACACGYSSTPVFSRAFSDFTGAPPRRYRERYGNKIAPTIPLSRGILR
jgi:transcriptional regulator GlxA family with amidase domain